MCTTYDTSPEAIAVYRATARRREARERRALLERRERAWQVARRTGAMLQELSPKFKVDLVDAEQIDVLTRHLPDTTSRASEELLAFADFLATC